MAVITINMVGTSVQIITTTGEDFKNSAGKMGTKLLCLGTKLISTPWDSSPPESHGYEVFINLP